MTGGGGAEDGEKGIRLGMMRWGGQRVRRVGLGLGGIGSSLQERKGRNAEWAEELGGKRGKRG